MFFESERRAKVGTQEEGNNSAQMNKSESYEEMTKQQDREI